MNKKNFFNILNTAIKINIDDVVYYCYNKNIERQKKYNKLFDLDTKITITKKDILFKIEKGSDIVWIDFDNVYVDLLKLYDTNIIYKWLKTNKKWGEYHTAVLKGLANELLIKKNNHYKKI